MMKLLIVILIFFSLTLYSNPYIERVIYEFEADTAQKIELHLHPLPDWYNLLNDSVITFTGKGVIDTSLWLWDTNFVIIDNSVITGEFYLPQDTGFIKIYLAQGLTDSISYPNEDVPSPKPNFSVSKWYHDFGIDGILEDWYIDSTPTFGFENDDYKGCKISGYVYSNDTPVNEAKVIATALIYSNFPPFYSNCTTFTSTDGFYLFDSLLPTNFWIKVEKEGFYPDSFLTNRLHSLNPITVNFNLLTGIEDDKISFKNFKVYPNPFFFQLNIILDKNLLPPYIRIYDISGRLIKEWKKETLKENLIWEGKDENGEMVSSGIYFIHIGEKKVKVTKL